MLVRFKKDLVYFLKKSCLPCSRQLCQQSGIWRWWCHNVLTMRLWASRSGKQVDIFGRQCEHVCGQPYAAHLHAWERFYPVLHLPISVHNSSVTKDLKCVGCLLHIHLKQHCFLSYSLTNLHKDQKTYPQVSLTEPVKTNIQLHQQENILYCVSGSNATGL